jgi:hypothetical protein
MVSVREKRAAVCKLIPVTQYTLLNIITVAREGARLPLALADSSLSPEFITDQNYHVP